MTLRHDWLRTEPPAGEAFARPEAVAVPDAVIDGGQRRSLAWWRLRSWKKDLVLLTRLRDGRALPDDPEDPDFPDQLAGPGTAEAGTAEVGTAGASAAGAGAGPDAGVRIHVKAVPGGWVSNTLVHHTEPGGEVILGPPLGTMTLPAAQDRDLLCVAGGTGLSPIKAITEQVIRDSGAGSRRRVYLYYGARRREELYDLRELWQLVDAYDGLQLTLVTSDDPAYHGMQGNVGRVAARYLPHDNCEAYMSGPAGMVRETLRVLGRAGIPAERMHYDDALLAGRRRIGTGT